MKNSIITKIASCVLALLIMSVKLSAQTTEAQSYSVKVTADVVSSYVWRGVNSPGIAAGGTLITMSPHFQPTYALTFGNLEVGAWGSTDFGGGYKEVDLYASYSAGSFGVTVTDYNWSFAHKYFNYKNEETDHIIEGTIVFKGIEALPLSISVSTMLFGADKKFDDTKTGSFDPKTQNYSTYIELGYAFSKFNVFVGVTPADGYYGDGYKYNGGEVEGFSVVNLGFTSSKTLKITDGYSLPLKATLGFNPQAENAYLVFGITF